MNNQKGKWIGLTGAAGGIGQSLIAECFEAYPDCRIIGLDLSAENLAKLEQKYGEKFIGIVQDVTQKEEFLKCLGNLAQDYGNPYLWFNNAGIASIGTFQEVGLNKFSKVMDVNFNSVVWATHFWLDSVAHNSECVIIQMASMAGKVASPMMSSYVASKFALVGFSKSLQLELEIQKSPARILLVTPGFIDTNIVQLGQHNGMPQELAFLLGDPADCAREILSAIRKKSLEVSPSITGKLFELGQKISPSIMRTLAVQSGKKMLSKKI